MSLFGESLAPNFTVTGTIASPSLISSLMNVCFFSNSFSSFTSDCVQYGRCSSGSRWICCQLSTVSTTCGKLMTSDA